MSKLDGEIWRRIDEVFSAAAELPADQRAAFLDQACAGRPELRREVEVLLAADDNAQGFLAQPIVKVGEGRRLAAASLALPADEIESKVGRIHLTRSLGRGGMGEVYVGFDETLKRKVAVKSLRHDRIRNLSSRAALLREARLLSRLNHKNVCQIYDFIEGDKRDYLVLEFIEGKTLRQAIREGVHRGHEMRLAEDVAAALAAAHGEGIIHRDLKPDNVMVTDDGEVKILDFGVARMVELQSASEEAPDSGVRDLAAADASTTVTGRILGTLRYMSPEQARGESATAASDMYSFGILLQELFSNTPPYDADLTPGALIFRVARGESHEVTGVDPDLKALIDRLKSPVPAARPTALDTAAHLRHIRDKPRRRARLWLAALAATVLALVAGIASVLAWRLAGALEETARQADIATSRRLTAEATSLLERRLDLAFLLDVEAYSIADTLDTRSGLLNALATSPRLLRTLGHETGLTAVAWSPDGEHVAACGEGSAVWLWDAANDFAAPRPLRGHEGRMWAVAWSPDGKLLASASSDQSVRLWDPVTGRQVDEPLSTHQLDLWTLAWSPDGERLATGGQEGPLWVWRPETGELLAAVGGERHTGGLWEVTWSRDGRLLAATDAAGKVRLWDGGTYELVAGPLAVEGQVLCAQWSPDSKLLALCGGDREVWLWDVERRESVGPPMIGHRGVVNDVAWRGDGRLLASAGADGTIWLWETATRRPRGRPLVGHDSLVNGLSFRPDGRRLASAGIDTKVGIWNVADGEYVGQPLEGATRIVTDVAVDPAGGRIAVSSFELPVVVWDLATGRVVRLLEGPPVAVLAVAWDPRGELVAGASDDGLLRLWEVATGDPLPPLDGHQRPLSGVSWSLDGKTLVSSGWDGRVMAWDPWRGTLLFEFEGSPDGMTSVAWSPDGTVLAAGDADGEIQLRSPDGRLLDRFEAHHGRVNELAWSSSGDFLASAGDDMNVALWEMPREGRPGRTLAAHIDRVWSIAWSADDRFLVSGGADKALMLWDVATGALVARIDNPGGEVRGVDWSREGHFVFLGDTAGAVRRHDVGGGPAAWLKKACRRAGRNLTVAEWNFYRGADVPYHRTCSESLLDLISSRPTMTRSRDSLR